MIFKLNGKTFLKKSIYCQSSLVMVGVAPYSGQINATTTITTHRPGSMYTFIIDAHSPNKEHQ